MLKSRQCCHTILSEAPALAAPAVTSRYRDLYTGRCLYRMQAFARFLSQIRPRNARSYATVFKTVVLPSSQPEIRLSRSINRTLRAVARVIKRRSGDPLWGVLDNRSRATVNLVKTLQDSGISMADYHQWEPVTHEDNFYTAMSHLNVKLLGEFEVEDGIDLASSPRMLSESDAQPPTWIVIHILFHLPEVRPPLLILAAYVLAAHQTLPVLQHLVAIFVALPIYDQTWHFNLFLRGIAVFANSRESGRFMGGLAVTLLRAVRSRELTLTSGTCCRLLENRFVTMELNNALRSTMEAQKFVPSARSLEAYARIFARRGAIHDAEAYLQQVRLMQRRRRPSISAAEMYNDPKPSSCRDDSDPGIFDDVHQPSSAFHYLQSLVEDKQRRAGKVFEWYPQAHRGSLRYDASKAPRSAAEWAARLYVRANNRTLSASNLVDYFQWYQTLPLPFRPATTMTYTILLSGLIARRRYDLAKDVWAKYRATELRLDGRALTVGLEVLTLAGAPDEALDLLEGRCQGSLVHRGALARGRGAMTMGVVVHTPIINSFMRVLLKKRRPDIVYRLWGHMRLLYGTKPDADTLCIFLNAARNASHSFESFSGALHELGFRNPFRRNPPSNEGPVSLEVARERARADLSLLARTNVKQTEMWDGIPAWRHAYFTFKHILFSNWPDLAHVKAPARALRTSKEEITRAPLRELKRSLKPSRSASSLDSIPPVHTTSEDILLNKSLHSLETYSSIVPNSNVISAYVHFLGSQSLASEIPLLLAWMRALDVQPRREALALALVYFREVSESAPMLEKWHAGQTSNEYVRLYRWLSAWVGEKGMPSEREIGKALIRIDRMRRS
ncbi:hypothetical protein EW146_g7630 [Bondarzewia mesenterica]|uniref:Uncharacterized protein n=1 Tax=Bondarzewia mesenterica TaxID=1095465 RepID=A0A4S4LM12_9AGAM|nr:hypothetical protein EW146_g7630 [Bondarzewia mesenterica]